MMKILKKDNRSDLKLLIELSCVTVEKVVLFEQFHKTLIAISYAATDVHINYERKRIYMNVVAEDAKGDFLTRVDNLMQTRISLNLTYDDLGDFLTELVSDKNAIPNEFFPLVKDKFFSGKSLLTKSQSLVSA